MTHALLSNNDGARRARSKQRTHGVDARGASVYAPHERGPDKRHARAHPRGTTWRSQRKRWQLGCVHRSSGNVPLARVRRRQRHCQRSNTPARLTALRS